MASKLSRIFALLMVVSSAMALTCYKCDSSQNTLCNYGNSSFAYNSVDCDEDFGGDVLTNWIPKQCVKLVVKGKDGSEYVARGCKPSVGGGACNEIAVKLSAASRLMDEIQDVDCFSCDEDNCNSATKFAGLALLGALLAAAALKL